MSVRRKVRSAIPGPIRQRLYDWSPSRRKRWKEVPGTERLPGDDAIAITFDDGPDATFTPPLLEALGEAGAKATFFVVGEQVAGSEELLREIEAKGHEVALHGMTHRRHDGLDEPEARVELESGLRVIEAAGVTRPRWYRPPYGGSSPILARLCDELGLGLAYWSTWGQDWEALRANRIAGLVLRDLGPGGIVLLHDSARYAERDDVSPTIAAIPQIAAAARSEDLAMVTLGAAFDGHG